METATARIIEKKAFIVPKYFVAARLRAFTRWSSRVRGANRRFEFVSVSGSCMSKHLQYPDAEAIPEDLNADG